MSFALNVLECRKCRTEKVVKCSGDCPCPSDADHQPVTRHARIGYCPENRFAKNHPRPPHWEKGESHLVESLSPTQLLPLIDAAPGALASSSFAYPNVREAYRIAMRQATDSCAPFPTDRFAGRGIVIPAGGNYFCAGFVTASILRYIGCTLPIEIWGLPSEPLEPWQATAIDGMGIAYRQPDPGEMRIEKGWPLKPWALLNSAFREVLFFDADAFPIREPSFLFNHPGYLRHGAAFWPDQASFDLRDEVWGILGLPSRKEPDCEAGVMLVNKEKSWGPLSLANWINQHSDYYYHVSPGAGGIHGDKTTFHLAWRYLGCEYAMPAKRWEGNGHQIITQHDFAGHPLVIHQIGYKPTVESNSARQERFPDHGATSRWRRFPAHGFRGRAGRMVAVHRTIRGDAGQARGGGPQADHSARRGLA